MSIPYKVKDASFYLATPKKGNAMLDKVDLSSEENFHTQRSTFQPTNQVTRNVASFE